MATGYTRQSSASIVDGLTISAANHNNEFNLLETAFNGTSGHDHSGGTGLGPILLPPAIGMSGDGIYARTSSTTTAARTITGTAAEITVTNGTGVSGNPTLSLPTALTFTGKTVTGGTFTGITMSSAAATITGGTISGITDIAVADGGTGSSTASGARTNLGLIINTDVQAFDAQLADVAGLTPTDNGVIIGNGTNFVVESGATLKTSLGLTINTNVQAYSANLDEYAAVNPTAAGLAILDDADAAAQRTTLGVPALAQGASAYINFNGTGTPTAYGTPYGFSSTITDNGTGDYTLTFDPVLSTANYVVIGMASGGSTQDGAYVKLHTTADAITTKSTSQVRILVVNTEATLGGQDKAYVGVVVFGG